MVSNINFRILYWSVASSSYVITGALTMATLPDDPVLQMHLQDLERYKKSLVDPYSQAAQDVCAAQAHLDTLTHYRYMLNRTIDILPSYCNPPDHE
jgi:hypothetical protein